MRIKKSSLVLGLFALLTSCLPANMSNVTTQIKSKPFNDSLIGAPKPNPYYGEVDLKLIHL